MLITEALVTIAASVGAAGGEQLTAVEPCLKDQVRGRLLTSCAVSFAVPREFGCLRDWVKDVARSILLLLFLLVKDELLSGDVGCPPAAVAEVAVGGWLAVDDAPGCRHGRCPRRRTPAETGWPGRSPSRGGGGRGPYTPSRL